MDSAFGGRTVVQRTSPARPSLTPSRPRPELKSRSAECCAILSVRSTGGHWTVKRRDFITLLGAAAWPLAAGAQTLRHRPLVGSLQVQSLTGSARYASEFLRGMAELCYVEGRNVHFEVRHA